MRDQPAEAFLGTMGDPPNVVGALWATRMSNVMALMAQGSVDLGFIGGAEVDRFGNLNTSYIGDPAHPTVKLPGSGGGADIAILSRRWVTLMTHERRRLVDRVSFITSPGYGDGTPHWRKRNGLLGGGPAAIITTRCVLRWCWRRSCGRTASRSWEERHTWRRSIQATRSTACGPKLDGTSRSPTMFPRLPRRRNPS